MRKDAVAWQKKVLARVNGIVSRCEHMENYLQSQEDIVENEKARIKAEAEAKEAARIQTRIDRICEFGATFNGQIYTTYGNMISITAIKTNSDTDFDEFIAHVQAAKEAEEARIKANEEARKAETERLQKIAEEQEAERERLEMIRKVQEEDAKKIKAREEEIEREKVRIIAEEEARKEVADREKKRIEDDKRRAEELAEAKKEAAEKAIRDAEQKAIQDAVIAQAEKERRAAEALREEMLRPDKDKLMTFANDIEMIIVTGMHDKDAQDVVDRARTELSKLANRIRKEARGL